MKFIKIMVLVVFLNLLIPITAMSASCTPSANVSYLQSSVLGGYQYDFTVFNTTSLSDIDCAGFDIISFNVFFISDANLTHVSLPANWEGSGFSGQWNEDTWTDPSDPIHDGMGFANACAADCSSSFTSPILREDSLDSFSFILDKDIQDFDYVVYFADADNSEYWGTTSVPEPATLILIGAGLAAVSIFGRSGLTRRKK